MSQEKWQAVFKKLLPHFTVTNLRQNFWKTDIQCSNFFNENNSVSPKLSSFKPGDSCINQLISITYEIYESLDAGLKVKSVFLGISKAFDNMRNEGVISKSRNENGIEIY